jgi:tRNA(fMet)-specific endonuclease VapC
MRWMLDTDTCIGLIRQRSASAIKKLGSRSVGQVGISSITLSELAYGASRSQQPERSRAALDEFLLPLVVAPYDDAAAFAYGEIRATLANAGTPIGPLDTLIAAHALALDVTLVTHNRREFERVPKLRVDDWLV